MRSKYEKQKLYNVMNETKRLKDQIKVPRLRDARCPVIRNCWNTIRWSLHPKHQILNLH